MSRIKNSFAALSILIIACLPMPVARSSEDVAPHAAPATNEGWREARAGYSYSFPRDHASHAPYQIEWWYYTGNLAARDGRRFGYQLTFFRTGVVPKPANPSRWAVRDLYMAHFAISDIDRESFHWSERLSRAGINWAGADATAYRVWNGDWEARLDGQTHSLAARDEGFALELKLQPSKPEVIHGQNGVSQKGPSEGNATHYYSLTRLPSEGVVVIDGERFDVTGESWMDHEFGTRILGLEQFGWDWFSIQLDDGRELMIFQIRRSDGSVDRRSSGTLIDAQGNAIHLPFGEFTLSPRDRWTSPASRATYPTAWAVEAPGHGLSLNVVAAFKDQELRATESTGVTYWEGAVEVSGRAGANVTRGRGYLEMTGYAGQSMGAIFQ
ncbi:MAG TPA: lipocalin-like domain-containing protein [Blastocatellia bacterium]|nr:lipocalin-like domain-containing protein [Blastocatellia bacterium]